MSDADSEKWNRRYREGAYAGRRHPSALLETWIEAIAPGRALDLACGAGRNALYLAERGFRVDAVDISGEALARVGESATAQGLELTCIQHDLDQAPRLDAGYQLILVIRYVNQPLLHSLGALLAPGGFLLCEEHLRTDADVIGPANPAYRVAPGDLAEAAADLQLHFLYEGLVEEPDGRTAALAQLVAQRQ